MTFPKIFHRGNRGEAPDQAKAFHSILDVHRLHSSRPPSGLCRSFEKAGRFEDNAVLFLFRREPNRALSSSRLRRSTLEKLEPKRLLSVFGQLRVRADVGEGEMGWMITNGSHDSTPLLCEFAVLTSWLGEFAVHTALCDCHRLTWSSIR